MSAVALAQLILTALMLAIATFVCRVPVNTDVPMDFVIKRKTMSVAALAQHILTALMQVIATFVFLVPVNTDVKKVHCVSF